MLSQINCPWVISWSKQYIYLVSDTLFFLRQRLTGEKTNKQIKKTCYIDLGCFIFFYSISLSFGLNWRRDHYYLGTWSIQMNTAVWRDLIIYKIFVESYFDHYIVVFVCLFFYSFVWLIICKNHLMGWHLNRIFENTYLNNIIDKY